MSKQKDKSPVNNMRFRLVPNYVVKLKPAIEALFDSEFNPEGLAMVDVTKDGIDMTIRNTRTNTVANLSLNASQLICFHCNKPILRKMIDLHRILEILKHGPFNEDYDDVGDDFVTVTHVDEFSSNLYFTSGKDPKDVSTIELRESNTEIDEMFPDIKFACQTVLESKILKEMIDGVITENEGTKLVSAYIGKEKVTIKLQLKTPLEYKFDTNDEEFEAMVAATTEEGYHAWFELRHLKLLKQALTLANRFDLCILNEPSGNVMIHFNLDEFGSLVFVQKAMLITKDSELASLVDGATNAEELVRITNNLEALNLG